MTGSMYAAIAGLKTHMSKMNVIGHNIANVNTNGYKAQRTVFKDAMYTMYRNGSNGTPVEGSRNPSQIGYGSQVSSIDLNMASGSYAPGNAMDCMINGDGFFLVGNKEVAQVIDPTNPTTFKSLQLTRVGDFKFGADGYLVDGSGNCVYGFLAVGEHDGEPIMSDQLVAIRLPRMEKVATAISTKAVTYVNNALAGNAGGGNANTIVMNGDFSVDLLDGVADPNDPQADPANVLIEGTDYTITYRVRYPVAAEVDPNAAGGNQQQTTTNGPLTGAALLDESLLATRLKDYVPATQAGTQTTEENPLAFVQLDSITIDEASGRISGTMKDTDQWITIGFLAVGNVTNPNGVTHEGGFYYSAGDGAGDLQISMLGGAAKELQLVGGKDFTHVNGSVAPLPDTDLNGDNVINAADAQLSLSRLAEIGNAGATELLTGGLEGSNVDLATEISEMITTQRGYQANTRIITVTDTMLEELVNMKR